jgi:hypothetical protein
LLHGVFTQLHLHAALHEFSEDLAIWIGGLGSESFPRLVIHHRRNARAVIDKMKMHLLRRDPVLLVGVDSLRA